MIQQIITFFNQIKFDMLWSFGIIVALTIFQKYHFMMLFWIESFFNFFLGKIISFVIRIGVIFHEFCHIIFALLAGGKITNIELFRKDGGKVSFSVPDYIGSLAYNKVDLWFFVSLIFNRIGVFLSSIGPLFIGIIFNMFLIKIFFGIPMFSNYFELNLSQIDITKITIFGIYLTIFLPAFILSRQDISNFLIYRGSNIFATFFGSLINSSIFLMFLICISYFFEYLKIFFIMYIISFGLILILFLILKIFELIKKLI